MKPTKNPILIPAAVSAFCCMAVSAQAALLVYEGNNYSSPSTLVSADLTQGSAVTNSVDGTISLTNATVVRFDGNGGSVNLATIGTQTLSYTDANSNTLTTSGGQATVLNARGVRYNTTVFAATGGTIYGSYLWQAPTLNGSSQYAGYFEIRNTTGLDARIGLGVNGTTTDTNLQVRYGATTNTTSLAITPSATYFMVYKLTYNATGQMTALDLWVNPDDLSSETISGTADLSYSGVIGGGGFGGFAYNKVNVSGGFNPIFDELRVGTTWADVTPTSVPEPSAFAALAGLGVLGFAASRRRRRA